MYGLSAVPRRCFCAMAVLCLLAAQPGCQPDTDSRPSAEDGPPPVPVTAVHPLKMMIVEWDKYTGRLDAIDYVEVRSRVSGYLESVHFVEGQAVKAGDLLAIIDPKPFEAELEAAKAATTEAQAQVEEARAAQAQATAEAENAKAQQTLARQRVVRVENLRNTGAITAEEYDERMAEREQAEAAVRAATARIQSTEAAIATAQAAVDRAQANVATAELSLGYTRIRAAADGLISRKYVTQGNLITGGSNSGTLLTTIVSIAPIHVYFDANEQEFLKYMRLDASGARASSRNATNPIYLSLIDEEGYPHQGHMDFVDNRVDPNTGTMRGRAILPNDDHTLTPGLFAEVRLPGSGRYEAILLPDKAINSDQDQTFVYLVKDDNSIERRNVKLGPLSHGLRIIREGLDGSELVVTEGLQMLRPNSVVKVEERAVEPQPSPLPDDYQPVPREELLSQPPDPVPAGIKQNTRSDGDSAGQTSPAAGQRRE